MTYITNKEKAKSLFSSTRAIINYYIPFLKNQSFTIYESGENLENSYLIYLIIIIIVHITL